MLGSGIEAVSESSQCHFGSLPAQIYCKAVLEGRGFKPKFLDEIDGRQLDKFN
ncbi:hypothetical protein CKA32_005736 [Geitlerinema sp. FC II]|nr:hypothetical protein CKA32_005736 [Geitlerinema sp. FC II]